MSTGIVTLFFASFLAATVLPFSSEALLAGMLMSREYAPWILWLAATLGNVGGSVVNWWLGRGCLRFRDRSWFPVSPDALHRAGERFRAWGEWSLLLAWVPVVGDPLTVAAGALGVPWARFTLLVALGKGGRYLLLLAFF